VGQSDVRHSPDLAALWCTPQASLSERFDKIVVLPTSWAWEDCLHAYLTLDIAKVSDTAAAAAVVWAGSAQLSTQSAAPGVDDLVWYNVVPAGWYQQGP
jgi:hypothetical protein